MSILVSSNFHFRSGFRPYMQGGGTYGQFVFEIVRAILATYTQNNRRCGRQHFMECSLITLARWGRCGRQNFRRVMLGILWLRSLSRWVVDSYLVLWHWRGDCVVRICGMSLALSCGRYVAASPGSMVSRCSYMRVPWGNST